MTTSMQVLEKDVEDFNTANNDFKLNYNANIHFIPTANVECLRWLELETENLMAFLHFFKKNTIKF